MTVHALKCLPPYFDDVCRGDKTFEIRKDDRDYKAGDTLILREWYAEEYTGRNFPVTVTYITDFEQKSGYVVMSIIAEE